MVTFVQAGVQVVHESSIGVLPLPKMWCPLTVWVAFARTTVSSAAFGTRWPKVLLEPPHSRPFRPIAWRMSVMLALTMLEALAGTVTWPSLTKGTLAPSVDWMVLSLG